MRLSTKGRYAVMAMADLAGNEGGTRPVSLAEIAKRQEISLSYLEQLFAKLRKGGARAERARAGRRLSLEPAGRPNSHRRHHFGGRTSRLRRRAARPAAPSAAPARHRGASRTICGKNLVARSTCFCRPCRCRCDREARTRPCTVLRSEVRRARSCVSQAADDLSRSQCDIAVARRKHGPRCRVRMGVGGNPSSVHGAGRAAPRDCGRGARAGGGARSGAGAGCESLPAAARKPMRWRCGARFTAHWMPSADHAPVRLGHRA